MKGWLLVKSEGEYEDYEEVYHTCYLDYKEAEKAMNDYNTELDKIVELASPCYDCEINYSKNITRPYCNKYCKSERKNLSKESNDRFASFDRFVTAMAYNEYYYCSNKASTDCLKQHHSRLKEINIIEQGVKNND